MAELTDFAVALRSGIALDQVFDGRVKMEIFDVVDSGIGWQHGGQREQICRNQSGTRAGDYGTPGTSGAPIYVFLAPGKLSTSIRRPSKQRRAGSYGPGSELCPSAVPQSGHCPGDFTSALGDEA